MNGQHRGSRKRKAATVEQQPSLARDDRATAKTRRRGRSTRNEDGSLNAVNVQFGGRLRLRRRSLGISQSKLAHAVGLTFQQIQKYEKGSSEVKASRIYDLARVLEVPVGFFFNDMAGAPSQPESGSAAREETGSAVAQDFTDQQVTKESVELVKAYYSIADPKVRRQVHEMTRALSAAASRTPEI